VSVIKPVLKYFVSVIKPVLKYFVSVIKPELKYFVSVIKPVLKYFVSVIKPVLKYFVPEGEYQKQRNEALNVSPICGMAAYYPLCHVEGVSRRKFWNHTFYVFSKLYGQFTELRCLKPYTRNLYLCTVVQLIVVVLIMRVRLTSH
jgi:hypothetical protein